MPDNQPQAGPPESGGVVQGKKRTWLVCGCIGCAVVFVAFVMVGLLSVSLVPAFLRELLVAR
jgi:hypothetical protein